MGDNFDQLNLSHEVSVMSRGGDEKYIRGDILARPSFGPI
jgi:hypothetical protein